MKLSLQRKNTSFLFIPLILILVTLPLIMRDFTPRDELKYIDISSTMIKTHNFFVQYFNNQMYTDKPPLYFWLIIISRYIFGGFYTYGIVLFNIAIESFMLIKLYDFLKKHFNYKASGIIVFLIISSILHYISIVTVRMDVFLNSFIVLSLINFFDCYKQGDYKKNYKTFIYIGFAFLFKGLVGVLTPLLVIIIFKFIASKKYTLKEIGLLKGLGIILLFVLFWLIPSYLAVGPIFIKQLLFKQIYGRAVNAYVHKKPFYYYLWTLPAIVFPWCIAFCYSLYKSIINKSKTDLDKFLLLWIGITVFYLSLVSSKIIIYLLPLTVPMMIITYIELGKASRKAKNIIYYTTALQLPILLIAIFFIDSEDFLPFKTTAILGLSIITLMMIIFIIKNKIHRAFYLSGSLMFILAICLGLNMKTFNKEIGFYKYKSIITKYVPNNQIIYAFEDDLLRTQFMIPNKIVSVKEETFQLKENNIFFLKKKNLDKIKVTYTMLYQDDRFCFIKIKMNGEM